MKISSRGRNAVRIMVDIATDKEEFTNISGISKRLNITNKYIEQIISKLVKAKLVTSLRGAQGGYKLARKPEEINIAEILTAMGDMPELAPCLKEHKDCPARAKCTTIGVWETLSALIFDYLEKITLQNLIEKTY